MSFRRSMDSDYADRSTKNKISTGSRHTPWNISVEHTQLRTGLTTHFWWCCDLVWFGNIVWKSILVWSINNNSIAHQFLLLFYENILQRLTIDPNHSNPKKRRNLSHHSQLYRTSKFRQHHVFTPVRFYKISAMRIANATTAPRPVEDNTTKLTLQHHAAKQRLRVYTAIVNFRW